MRQDKINEYYNIDFEKHINIHNLMFFMSNKFKNCNISIRYNQDNIEIINNNYNDFNICVYFDDLKTGEVYDFLDVKIRGIMYIDTGYNFDSSKIIKLLSEMSKTFQSKIYVSMDDIEKTPSSFSYFSVWCIDGDKMKIMFDTQEFFDDCKNQYSEYLPLS